MKKFFVALVQVIGYAASVVFVMLVFMAITKAAGFDWEAGSTRIKILGDGIFLVAGVGVVNGLLARFSRSQAVRAGWPAIGTAVKWFLLCVVLGAVVAAAMILLTVVTGGGRLELTGDDLPTYLNVVVPLLGCLLISALGEEWFFRGYALTRLAQALGPFWANVFVALLFATAHVGSKGWTSLVGLNIVIGSLLVGTLRFTPGGIPAAWGFHFAWNSFQMMAGAPVTGENLVVPGVRFASEGPVWSSGGTLGPEGDVGATIATGAALVLLAIHVQRRRYFKKYGR